MKLKLTTMSVAVLGAVQAFAANGAIVVYRQADWAGDTVLFAVCIDRDTNSVWPDPGWVRISGESRTCGQPVAVTDGAGGAIVVYEALTQPEDSLKAAELVAKGLMNQSELSSYATNQVELRATHVRADGRAAWDGEQVLLARGVARGSTPAIVSDGSGGAITAFRLGTGEAGNAFRFDIRVQRVTVDGKLAWTGSTNGVSVAQAIRVARDPALLAVGSGGVIVAFEDETNLPNTDIWVQRLDANGSLQWGEAGHPVRFAYASDAELNPALAPAQDGGALVAYEYEFLSTDHPGDCDIVAQGLGPTGSAVWHDGNAPTQVAGSHGRETHPKLLTDGSGGAFVVYNWESTDAEKDSGDVDVLVQRLGADGKLVWDESKGPVAVASSHLNELRPVVVGDDSGGIIAAFEMRSRSGDDCDIDAQRVSADGSAVWNQGDRPTDIAATDAVEQHPAAVADGEGGAFVVYESCDSVKPGAYRIMAQRINRNGELSWPGGRPVGNAVTSPEGPLLIAR